MKRLDRIAKDKGEDLEVVREGAEHTIVRIGKQQTSIPRHREIVEITAQKIIKHMEKGADE